MVASRKEVAVLGGVKLRGSWFQSSCVRLPSGLVKQALNIIFPPPFSLWQAPDLTASVTSESQRETICE